MGKLLISHFHSIMMGAIKKWFTNIIKFTKYFTSNSKKWIQILKFATKNVWKKLFSVICKKIQLLIKTTIGEVFYSM